MDYVVVLIVLVLLVPLGIAISRSTELFVLRAEGGRVRLVRGRLPNSLLADLREVLERSQETGTLRVTVSRGAAQVNVKGGFSEATVQRLRNVVGTVPLQRIRTGARS